MSTVTNLLYFSFILIVLEYPTIHFAIFVPIMPGCYTPTPRSGEQLDLASPYSRLLANLPSLTKLPLKRRKFSSQKSLSSKFITLIVEIKHLILSYLVNSNEPALTILQCTYRSLPPLITNSAFRCRPSTTALGSQLSQIEYAYPYMILPDHFPYYVCLQVKPESQLMDDMRTFWASIRRRTYCLSCCIKSKIRPGTINCVDGKRNAFCSVSRKYFEAYENRRRICCPSYRPLRVLITALVIMLLVDAYWLLQIIRPRRYLPPLFVNKLMEIVIAERVSLGLAQIILQEK